MGSNPTLSAITLPMITSCFVMKQEVFACRWGFSLHRLAEAGLKFVLRSGGVRTLSGCTAGTSLPFFPHNGETIDDVTDKRPGSYREHVDHEHFTHGDLVDIREHGSKPGRHAEGIKEQIQRVPVMAEIVNQT